MNTDVSVRQNLAESRFEIPVDGVFAVAEYELANGSIRFTHTRVPPELQGRGLAITLVKAGLQAAADKGWSVIPQCEFFAADMRKHPETRGLLSEEGRELLDGPVQP